MANLDTGNTGFMILCSSLVMLMTPGLAFFYGGLVSRRNVLTIMMQSFVSMGWTTVIWFVVGYSLCFSGDIGGVIGNLDMAFLRGVTLATPSPTPGIPLFVHIAYQMMFAIITPALITGAFANRVSFKAYMAFLTLWLLFVYFPFVHMIWGGGFLQRWGVLEDPAPPAAMRWIETFFDAYGDRVTTVDDAKPLVGCGAGMPRGWPSWNVTKRRHKNAPTRTRPPTPRRPPLRPNRRPTSNKRAAKQPNCAVPWTSAARTCRSPMPGSSRWKRRSRRCANSFPRTRRS